MFKEVHCGASLEKAKATVLEQTLATEARRTRPFGRSRCRCDNIAHLLFLKALTIKLQSPTVLRNGAYDIVGRSRRDLSFDL